MSPLPAARILTDRPSPRALLSPRPGRAR